MENRKVFVHSSIIFQGMYLLKSDETFYQQSRSQKSVRRPENRERGPESAYQEQLVI